MKVFIDGDIVMTKVHGLANECNTRVVAREREPACVVVCGHVVDCLRMRITNMLEHRALKQLVYMCVILMTPRALWGLCCGPGRNASK